MQPARTVHGDRGARARRRTTPNENEKLRPSVESRDAIEAAQAEARRIVEEATQRREDIEAVIGDLIRRRDDVIADTEELAGKLSHGRSSSIAPRSSSSPSRSERSS